MRNASIGLELNLFGVNKNELNVARTCLIENTHNNTVDTYGFTRTGSTCNKHMGHLSDIEINGITANVLTESRGQNALLFGKLGSINK